MLATPKEQAREGTAVGLTVFPFLPYSNEGLRLKALPVYAAIARTCLMIAGGEVQKKPLRCENDTTCLFPRSRSWLEGRNAAPSSREQQSLRGEIDHEKVRSATAGDGRTASCTVTVRYTVWQWIIRILLFGWLWY